MQELVWPNTRHVVMRFSSRSLEVTGRVVHREPWGIKARVEVVPPGCTDVQVCCCCCCCILLLLTHLFKGGGDILDQVERRNGTDDKYTCGGSGIAGFVTHQPFPILPPNNSKHFAVEAMKVNKMICHAPVQTLLDRYSVAVLTTFFPHIEHMPFL